MPDQDRDNQELLSELEELRVRLEEAEETLRAIREGEVDAVVVSGPRGEQVYSLSQPLQEQLHFLQTLIDAIPTPVYYKGANRLFLGCNRAVADYVGRTKEEIVGNGDGRPVSSRPGGAIYQIGPGVVGPARGPGQRIFCDPRRRQPRVSVCAPDGPGGGAGDAAPADR